MALSTQKAVDELKKLLVPDRHVRRDGSHYFSALLDLLPQGLAWTREPDSTLGKTCRGLAEYWGFVDSRAADLLEIESDPRTTIELLPDWERAWGLPDPCFPPGTKIVETFGPNLLTDNWTPFATTVDPVTPGSSVLALKELVTNSSHQTYQYFTPKLAAGKHRISLQWKSTGPTLRGIYVSVESPDSGANIWVKPDGVIDSAKTLIWGGGITHSGDASNTLQTDGTWKAEFTVDVTAADRFNLFRLILINEAGLTTYLGVEPNGIEFSHYNLSTVTQEEVQIPRSIAERRSMLLLVMTMIGGQSRAWFKWVADWIGMDLHLEQWVEEREPPLDDVTHNASIHEWSPFMAGISHVGDTRMVYDKSGYYRWEIGPPEMRFYWTIQPANAQVVWFRAASSQAGVDPHVQVRTPEDLACLFRRWKPAHTELVFDFSSLAAGGPMQGTP